MTISFYNVSYMKHRATSIFFSAGCVDNAKNVVNSCKDNGLHVHNHRVDTPWTRRGQNTARKSRVRPGTKAAVAVSKRCYSKLTIFRRMKTMRSFSALCTLVFVLAFVSFAVGQERKVVNGGVLNGRALKLPKPAYPEAAKAMKAEGAVAVDIEIDVNGNVVSAIADIYYQHEKRAEDGTKLDPMVADPLLRQAAEDAARGAKFDPMLLDGQAVNVKGRIVYNFVAGDQKMATETVTVDGSRRGDTHAGTLSPTAKSVNRGVLNGIATSLPKPAYPPAAMAVNAEGAVSVQVIVVEGGHVIAAAAVSGHPLLRAAAEAAAREATFSPTRLSGEPVKVSGVITYNFVSGKKTDQ
jgi:TonB family protein